MEILLLGIYAFFVWLIFIKFKWLPWNIYSQVTVVVIPIVALTALVLTLNVVAPSSSDVRVFRYTVPIVSQVRGRVIEVPIEEGNVPVKNGEVLFRIDPTPYQLQVNTLQAQLANRLRRLAAHGVHHHQRSSERTVDRHEYGRRAIRRDASLQVCGSLGHGLAVEQPARLAQGDAMRTDDALDPAAVLFTNSFWKDKVQVPLTRRSQDSVGVDMWGYLVQRCSEA